MLSSSFPDFSSQQAQQSWALLSNAIELIYQKQASTLSYEELYRNAYYLILHKYGDMTYTNLQNEFYKIINKLYLNISLTLFTKNNWLKNVGETWKEGNNIIGLIKNIFLYMDKNYVENRKLECVQLMGYRVFKEIFLEKNPEFVNKIVNECLEVIKKERDSEIADTSSVKSIVTMLVGLGLYFKQPMGWKKLSSKPEECYSRDLYKKILERRILEETGEYYKRECEKLIVSCTCQEYLEKCKERLNEEKKRFEKYLDDLTYNQTFQEIKKIFFENYIGRYAKTLVEMEGSGLVFLLQNEKYEVLQTMHMMFSFLPQSLELFRQGVSSFVKDFVWKINGEKKQSKKEILDNIEDIFKFKEKMVNILENSFKNSPDMSKIIKDAFVLHINLNPYINKILNIYIDNSLRLGFRNKNDAETEIYISKILDLFKLLTDKDLFEVDYKIFLAKRLINGNSLSKEVENNLLTKFKLECGAHYTSKIAIMFNDINLSSELMVEFNQSLLYSHKKVGQDFDLEVKVITKGSWPFEEEIFDQTFFLPQIRSTMESFEKFYQSKYKGRKICFTANSGIVNIKANYKLKKREFLVSTYQMCILNLFNFQETISLAEILQKIRFKNMEELLLHLDSLVEFKILNKVKLERAAFEQKDKEINLERRLSGRIELETKMQRSSRGGGEGGIIGTEVGGGGRGAEGEGVENNDIVFSINHDFTHKNYKMEVPLIRRINDETRTEEKNVESLFIERKHVIEASVIRIMKARRKMEHSALVNEVGKMCNCFLPSQGMIKQIIESLISRDYLERCEDKNWYSYIA